MLTKLTHVSIPVPNYDEAIQFYTEKFGMKLTADIPFGPEARWVNVKTDENAETALVLHVPFPGQELPPVTHYCFGSTDCRADVARWKENGVTIIQEPEDQMWGVQAIVADPYGNSYVIVEEKPFQG